ncbi:hypothetical protein ACIGGE_17950, partial [Qipengyuania sp. NPDC077410]|uniref:hypothetical protein n=1 Tax=Qipengyuania sp. NPDC077410 TaxID=3364496 RepID=UPI0037C9700A
RWFKSNPRNQNKQGLRQLAEPLFYASRNYARKRSARPVRMRTQIRHASGRSGNLADFVCHVPKAVVLIIDYFSFGSVTLPNEDDRDRCRSDQGSSDCPKVFRTW